MGVSAESPSKTFVRMRLFEEAPFAAGQVKDEGHEHVDLSFSSLPGREQSVLQAGKKKKKAVKASKK